MLTPQKHEVTGLSSSKKEQNHHKSGPYNSCSLLQVFVEQIVIKQI